MNPVQINEKLVAALEPLRFAPPVTHVYNPLLYAQRPNRDYLQRYGTGRRQVVFLGMNPGPWGMVQTGVPFGEVKVVRDWLGIDAAVGKPDNEHPKRLVTGFACTRSEVSGARLWGWARDRFETPERFFEHFFIANYCPLAFMEETGRNRTPDKLPAAERQPLLDACDAALRRLIDYFEPRWVIGIGNFAERRAREALAGMEVRIGRILHPSPASPAANRDWAGTVTKQLEVLELL